MIALDNLFGERSEITLLVDHLPKVGLSEDSQGVSSNLAAFAGCSTLDKVRYCSELALGNDLKGFACLEGKTVLWNVDLGDLTRAGVDV